MPSDSTVGSARRQPALERTIRTSAPERDLGIRDCGANETHRTRPAAAAIRRGALLRLREGGRCPEYSQGTPPCRLGTGFGVQERAQGVAPDLLFRAPLPGGVVGVPALIGGWDVELTAARPGPAQAHDPGDGLVDEPVDVGLGKLWPAEPQRDQAMFGGPDQ